MHVYSCVCLASRLYREQRGTANLDRRCQDPPPEDPSVCPLVDFKTWRLGPCAGRIWADLRSKF